MAGRVGRLGTSAQRVQVLNSLRISKIDLRHLASPRAPRWTRGADRTNHR